MPERGPRRPFTPREEAIADGIERGLSYDEIGATLPNLRTGKRGISGDTVDRYVETMAMLFDAYYDNELAAHFTPREIIWLYTRYRRLWRKMLDKIEADAKARILASKSRQ